jgi:predicted nucleic acid-binding protein
LTKFIVFDSSVLIDMLRARLLVSQIRPVEGIIRNSSVVLAELSRGARSKADQELLHALERNHPVLTPTEKNWLESGQILGKMHAEKGFTPAKLRDLHFDVLIALTVRSHGAKLITSNRADFELIHRYRQFELEVW